MIITEASARFAPDESEAVSRPKAVPVPDFLVHPFENLPHSSVSREAELSNVRAAQVAEFHPAGECIGGGGGEGRSAYDLI